MKAPDFGDGPYIDVETKIKEYLASQNISDKSPYYTYTHLPESEFISIYKQLGKFKQEFIDLCLSHGFLMSLPKDELSMHFSKKNGDGEINAVFGFSYIDEPGPTIFRFGVSFYVDEDKYRFLSGQIIGEDVSIDQLRDSFKPFFERAIEIYSKTKREDLTKIIPLSGPIQK